MNRVDELNHMHLPLPSPEILRNHLRITLHRRPINHRKTPKPHIQIRTTPKDIGYDDQTGIGFAIGVMNHHLNDKVMDGQSAHKNRRVVGVVGTEGFDLLGLGRGCGLRPG